LLDRGEGSAHTIFRSPDFVRQEAPLTQRFALIVLAVFSLAGPVPAATLATPSPKPAPKVRKATAHQPAAARIPAVEGHGPVVVLRLDGVVDPVMARYVERGYHTAQEEGAQCVVLSVNTPGGLMTSMREIVGSTLNSSVPTIGYVNPKGALAGSAGAFIMMACSLTAMAPETTMGAAHPVGGKGEDISKHLDAKVTNDAAALMRSLATQRGRNADWAEQVVTKSLSVNEREALAKKVIDGIPDTLDLLLKAFDGRKVEAAGVVTTLHLPGARIIVLDMGLRERFFHVLAHPELAYILMTLGTLGLIFELQSPHGVTGIAGLVCLVLALISLSIIPFSAGGLALMALGVGLFIADLKLMTHGALSLAGLGCLLLGSLMLFSPIEPFWHVSRILIFGVTGMTAAFLASLVYLGISAQHGAHRAGHVTLVGERGVALSDIGATGVVRVRGEEWSATLAEGAPRVRKGHGIIIRGVNGLTVEIEPAGGTPAAAAKRSTS